MRAFCSASCFANASVSAFTVDDAAPVPAVIDGAESFLIIWKNIPKYNFLYKIFKIKPLFFFLNIFYEIAAYFLFLKNKHLLKK